MDNDWLTIATDVSTANALLDADFAWYTHADAREPGDAKLRTLSYSVPDALASHVDLVQPTTRFGHLARHRSTIFEKVYLDEAAEADVNEKVANNAAANDAAAVSTTTDATAAADAAPCTTTVTPACLKALYNIAYTPATDGNLVAFASYLEEYARYSDLAQFEAAQLPQAVGQNFSVTLVNGGLDAQNSNDDSGMYE